MKVPPFHDYLGIELVRRAQGEAEVALELQPHHLNVRGVAHGGVISALLDSALGAAVISTMPAEWWCATTSLSTQFIAGATSDRLTATGRVSHRGAQIAFASGEVRNAEGRLMATAHGSWRLWPHHPGRPRPSGSILSVRGTTERLRPGKIVAVGRNYAEHIREMGAPRGAPPVVFLKPPSALTFDGGTVRLPAGAGRVDHEVELVVLIGQSGSRIAEDRALDHVLGYAVGLDLTLRELQSEAKSRGEPWTLAKGFDGSAPVSHVALRDEVGDGSGLAISLAVNGQLRQQGNTGQMIHGVAELVAHVSRWMTLERGDLLFTGTPAGVGPVQPGDRLQARLDKVGTLEITIDAED